MTTINIFITVGAEDKVSVKRVEAKKHERKTDPRLFSPIENHILEVVAALPDVSAMRRDKFVVLCSESLPAPEAGERDSRMVRASTAITDLSKGKDAPFREIDGVIHFLVS